MDNNHTNFRDHPVYKRLLTSGPKRILSLDDRQGALVLTYLEEIEKLFIDRYNDSKFVLSDYFDLIGGTGTTALIATFVALGKPIREIKEIYLGFENKTLRKILSNHPDLINLTLGSEKFKTGLAIFTKRTEALSTIVFHNHPSDENYKYNNSLFLIDLLDTSLASPPYSISEQRKFTDNKTLIFNDRDISEPTDLPEMLFLMTTNKAYDFQWRASKDHLLMIIIGSGPYVSFSHPLEYHWFGERLNKHELDELEKDNNTQFLYRVGNVAAKKEVLSTHFPTSFDFGVRKPSAQPISQEEIKRLFAPILKERGRVYKKCKRVFAKKAESTLEISTITSDGVETKNTAEKGDFIVKNQTSSKEQYVIKNENFAKRYEAINKLPDGIWTEYSPKGEVTGIQLSENLLEKLELDKHFNLMASWGQAQYCTIGDYIVNPVNEDGYYRIGLKEFNETYAIKKAK